jgi:DNA invertase Pin-like site-specific DNA recombinase
MDYGYCRISGKDQCELRQTRAMNELKIPPSNVFVDKQSGKDFDRPAYKELVSKLKAGDVLFLGSLDRLGRNYDAILENWKMLTKEKGVDIVILDAPLLDTRRGRDLIGTLISDIILAVMSFFCQNEREAIRQRQREGIAAAKARGVHLGRPKKPIPSNFSELVKRWENRQLNKNEILKMCDISQSTFYLRRAEIQRKNQ